MLISTDDFMNKLKEFRGDQNQVMVNFDVFFLFTSVPLEETINIIAEYIFSDSTYDSLPMSKGIFIKLMKLAIQVGGWTVRFSPRSQHHGPGLHSEANL